MRIFSHFSNKRNDSVVCITCIYNFDFKEMLTNNIVNFQQPTRARGYKTFFVLNSTEHEIYPAKNSFDFGYFNIYEHFKVHAQLS